MPPANDPPPSVNLERTCLVILAVVASGAVLYLLAGILTPPAMALFLAIVIDGFARVLEHRLVWVSKRAAMPLAIILSVLLFGGAVYVIADNATAFAARLVAYTPRLNEIIAQLAAVAHLKVAPTLDELVGRLNPALYVGDVAKGLQGFASNAVFILIYLGFILASRRAFERKMVSLAPSRAGRHGAMETFQRIRDGVEQYLWVQTVTGLMIAVASWLVMVLVGLDNAVFWAFLIFIAAYIPIVGGAIGILAPPLFALLQFPDYWQAVTLVVVLQSIQFLVGNLVLPRMQGDSLNIAPVVLLLSLAFWGVIWGLPGMFLSTPLTVTAMVICAQFPGARWVAILLSANGDPKKLHERKTPSPPDEKARAEKRPRVTQP
jgi:AI-2 transport protein TqsA